MAIKVFTVPFDTNKEYFHDEELSLFLLNKNIKRLCPNFFQVNDKAYWTVFIEYEVIVGIEKSDPIDLNEAQSVLLKRFKEWRKEKADKEKVPVFIIATNQQLLDIIKRAPTTLEAVREVQGFGRKKVERYGQEIIDMIKAFYEKKALSPVAAKEFSKPTGKESYNSKDNDSNQPSEETKVF